MKQEMYWRNEWGGDAFFANYNSRSRDVAISMNRKHNSKVTDVRKASDGQSIIVCIQILKVSYTLLNINAPNEDKPEFLVANLLN